MERAFKADYGPTKKVNRTGEEKSINFTIKSNFIARQNRF
jgi:hypothetical protein